MIESALAALTSSSARVVTSARSAMRLQASPERTVYDAPQSGVSTTACVSLPLTVESSPPGTVAIGSDVGSMVVVVTTLSLVVAAMM